MLFNEIVIVIINCFFRKKIDLKVILMHNFTL